MSNNMPEHMVHRFTLHAQSNRYKRKLYQARTHVHIWLMHCFHPYVSFSGGKDSTVVLHLVREISPSCKAVYWDADCAYPEVAELVRATPNITIFKTTEPFLDTLERYGLDAGGDLEKATMKSTVWEPVRAYIDQEGVDGCAYGLRKEESRARRMHGITHGAMFKSKMYDIWMCQPIIDWTYDDVWAYIVSKNIPYAGTYDLMWDMPENEQRVSYWAGETNRQFGRYVFLKRHYPDLWNSFCKRFPEARGYV